MSARVLLGLQDQLSCLEEDLGALEKRVREKDAPDTHNGSFRQETQDERQSLVFRAQHLLREYSQSWRLGDCVCLHTWTLTVTS